VFGAELGGKSPEQIVRLFVHNQHNLQAWWQSIVSTGCCLVNTHENERRS
jgi:hypothetical protein